MKRITRLYIIIAFLVACILVSVSTLQLLNDPLIGICHGLLKTGISFGLSQVALKILHPEYYKVIFNSHDTKTELKYNSQSYREYAFRYYTIYFISISLIIALS